MQALIPDGFQCKGKIPVVQDPIVRLIDCARFAILAADKKIPLCGYSR